MVTYAEDNPYPYILVNENATDGSGVPTPAADYRELFLGEDGALHLKDSSGTVTAVGGAGGAMATDALWDAAGDLAVGTGANTGAKLTLGATGKVPQSNGSTLAYVYPPGYEFDYSALTSSVSITATSEGTANTVKASNSVTYPGSVPVWVEFWAPYAEPTTGSTNLVYVMLEDSTVIGLAIQSSESATQRTACHLMFRRTPSNAAHTYTVKAYVGSGTGTIGAGAGGTGAYVNAWIRVVAV